MYEAVGELMDRWINDPGFRAEVRADPEAAVRRAGVQLRDEEWQALRQIDWSLTDDELRARMSNAA